MGTVIKAVTDFPLDHPRRSYFDEFARHVQASTKGAATVDLTSSPAYAASGGIVALKEGRADLAWVSVAYMEQAIAALGLATLPYIITDSLMGGDGAVQKAVAFFNTIMRPEGLELLAIMRGADQIVMLKEPRGAQGATLANRRVRVTGPGHLSDIVRMLDGVPVPLPIHLTKAALLNGEIEGVMSSPGVWQTIVGKAAPHALLVPDLSLLTYWLVGSTESLPRQPAAVRQALAQAALAAVNSRWTGLYNDDRAILDELTGQGFTLEEVAHAQPWKDKVAPMAKVFEAAHPGLIRGFLDSAG